MDARHPKRGGVRAAALPLCLSGCSKRRASSSAKRRPDKPDAPFVEPCEFGFPALHPILHAVKRVVKALDVAVDVHAGGNCLPDSVGQRDAVLSGDGIEKEVAFWRAIGIIRVGKRRNRRQGIARP